MTLEVLARGAQQLGIDLTVGQLSLFERYASELTLYNRRINLTRIVDPDLVQTRHFLDSLTCALPVLPQLVGGAQMRCIDVGSGAGFPGLPLKIAFPALSTVLLEATSKKATFLEHVVGALGLPGVAVVNGRAEELARDASHRDAYDLAVARALARLPVALELCLPFVRPGGCLVLPRGRDAESEVDSSQVAARQLGATLRPPVELVLETLPANRVLIAADKSAPTDPRFPRRTGVAGKRPLP